MTTFILVRHGETDYHEVIKKGYVGQAKNFAKLSPTGRMQAQNKIEELKNFKADVIVSSPYTRALETASIINQKLNLEIFVENDLHEWIVDTNFEYKISPDLAFKEYMESRGVINNLHKGHWETYHELQKRVNKALNKYLSYNCVLVICHANVMRTQTFFDDRIEYLDHRIINKK